MAKTYTRALPLRLTKEDEKKLSEVRKMLNEATDTRAIINALYQLPRYIKLYKDTAQSLENQLSINNNLNRRINTFSGAFKELIAEDKPNKKSKTQLLIED